jgi:hypothetical protein
MRNENVYLLDPVTSALLAVGTLPGTVATGTTLLTGAEIGGKTYLYSFNAQDIFRSTDNGNTWTLQGNIGKWPFMENSFAMSRHDTDLVYFGDIEVWRSTDAGGSWNHVSDWWAYYASKATKLHADIPAILPMYDAGGNEFQFVCTDGGLFRSTDDVVNVNNLSLSGLNVSQYYTVYTNRLNTNYIYVGTQDQGYQRCKVDSGTVLGFDQVISGDYGHIVSSNEGQSVWLLCQRAHWHQFGFLELQRHKPTVDAASHGSPHRLLEVLHGRRPRGWQQRIQDHGFLSHRRIGECVGTPLRF